MKITIVDLDNRRSLRALAEGIPQSHWRVLESGISSMHPGHCEFSIYYYAKHPIEESWVVRSCGLNPGADPDTFYGDDIDQENYSVIAVCYDVPEDDPEAISDLIYGMLWDEGYGLD